MTAASNERACQLDLDGGLPPFHVESFPGHSATGWHCVCDELGRNVLVSRDSPGVKFTTMEAATEICGAWNVRHTTTKGETQ